MGTDPGVAVALHKDIPWNAAEHCCLNNPVHLPFFQTVINRHRYALAGFPCHTTGHTGPYHGGSAG
jgi:hypothetical protein